MLVLFCLLAGLFAQTRLATRSVGWLERGLLSKLPGYNFLKGISESLVGFETDHRQEVVLARIEDSWQIGFLMERLEKDHYAVFVPGAPSIWSGSVYLMTEERFQRINISRAEAMKCLGRLGEGTNELLAGRTLDGRLASRLCLDRCRSMETSIVTGPAGSAYSTWMTFRFLSALRPASLRVS